MSKVDLEQFLKLLGVELYPYQLVVLKAASKERQERAKEFRYDHALVWNATHGVSGAKVERVIVDEEFPPLEHNEKVNYDERVPPDDPRG